jgi:hypothetical protein
MLTPGEFARQCDERARVAKVAQQGEAGQGWMASRMFDGGRGAGSEAEMLRREVSRGPAERDDPGPDAGLSPSEILRGLQERQVAGVVTARMPGPHGWAALELGLPGGPEGDPGRALKGGLTPQHSAAEAALDVPDDDEDQAEEARRRVQHEADPYPADAPEVHDGLGKAYRDAVPGPGNFPVPSPVDMTGFQRPPLTAGQPAASPDWEPPRQSPLPPVVLASVPESALAALRRTC